MKTQKGAALLVAMLTVALVATLSSAALWQQWRQVEIESAERGRSQTAWMMTAMGLGCMAIGFGLGAGADTLAGTLLRNPLTARYDGGAGLPGVVLAYTGSTPGAADDRAMEAVAVVTEVLRAAAVVSVPASLVLIAVIVTWVLDALRSSE